jgi:hypothetical protein
MIIAHNDQLKAQADHKTKASIKSLPPEIVIMIMEILSLKDALELCHALELSEQLAAQYFYYEWNDLYHILHYMDLKPNSYKFLLKNKRFQTKAESYGKTLVALRTLDLKFIMNFIEEFKLDLNRAFVLAADIGFIDVVKLLLSDSGVDPSAWNNDALIYAAEQGHVETVKLLLSDSRVEPSARDNEALKDATRNGHTEVVKLLLSDSRVEPSGYNSALRIAALQGHTEVVKLLLSDSRVEPSAWNNGALRNAAQNGHTEIFSLLLVDSRVELSDVDFDFLIYEAEEYGHPEVVKLLESHYSRFLET